MVALNSRHLMKQHIQLVFIANERYRAGAMSGGKRRGRVSRQRRRSGRPEIAAGPREGCKVQGNMSANGARIDHSQGSRDDERVRMNNRSGQRMLCRADEAKAAGWRVSRRLSFVQAWRGIPSRVFAERQEAIQPPRGGGPVDLQARRSRHAILIARERSRLGFFRRAWRDRAPCPQP